MDRSQLAKMIDHTLLKPEATVADVVSLCEQAAELGTYSVCVSPTFVVTAVANVSNEIKVATVCGFPSGKHESSVKAAEAKLSAQQGADEIDMVIDLGRAIMGDWDYIQSDVAAVRAATMGKVLKVILETAALTDEQIAEACRRCEAAGADFVKTATGFHPSGGADVRAIKVMHETVGGRLGIKASGGIKTAEFAQELIAAGATRLGLSGSRAILDGVAATGSY
ncbi:MAG: deoxyribose-phosphate aldolase [Candidatus Nanopelagicales bacterium]|nr:deoxyribose-phosphate aldolase [Candidatus Nanopelagicales bacterium]